MVVSPARKKSPVKWLLVALVIAAAIYYVPGLMKGGKGAAGGPQGGGVPVSVATVVTKPVRSWAEFSGVLEAVRATEIHPQVSGKITGIHFVDGTEVKRGQPLFTIDPRPYEAALISAKGAYAQAQAAYARAGKLIKTKAISQAEYESAQSAYNQALGNYKLAEVNMDYTAITAPISGKISRAEITEGNLVQAGQNAPLLASIVSVSPIYVSFDIDEQNFLKSIQGVPANKLKQIPVQVMLANSKEPLIATVHSFDNQIAPGSGTIRVRATLPNKDGTLIPGLYAKVRVGSADEQEAVLVNATAVGTDQSKKFVMVVGEDNKVQYREVTLDGTEDGLQIITSGLKPGEKIVASGLQRVQMPGTQVQGTEVDMTTLKPLNPPADASAAPADAPKTEVKPAGDAAEKTADAADKK